MYKRSTQSLNESNVELVNDMPAMINDVSDDNMWNDGCLTQGLEDLLSSVEEINKVVDDNCANDPITNGPTVSQPSIRNVYSGKKKSKMNNLQNTVAATKSFAAISKKKTKIKANYYEKKLILLERIAAAEEKKAEALTSIAQSLESRYKI
ncbi:uncharacterized protein LOC126553735 [Aphis gossypii]|uniref:uncharacterized protein LOC126553735 n=1 Tax=Aphis gossypii TaxID=80765 RepID=UPI00215945F8|nr:uncharacterized protein LOC126553735 [Aphis gossypii]